MRLGLNRRVGYIGIAVIATVLVLTVIPYGPEEGLAGNEFTKSIYGYTTGLRMGWNIWSPGIDWWDGLHYFTAQKLIEMNPDILLVISIDELNSVLRTYVRGDPSYLDFRILFYNAYYIFNDAPHDIWINVTFPGRQVIHYSHDLLAGWNFVGTLQQDSGMWIHDWVSKRVRGETGEAVAVKVFVDGVDYREDYTTYPIGAISLYNQTPFLQTYVEGDEIEHPKEVFKIWPGDGLFLWVNNNSTLYW